MRPANHHQPGPLFDGDCQFLEPIGAENTGAHAADNVHVVFTPFEPGRFDAGLLPQSPHADRLEIELDIGRLVDPPQEFLFRPVFPVEVGDVDAPFQDGDKRGQRVVRYDRLAVEGHDLDRQLELSRILRNELQFDGEHVLRAVGLEFLGRGGRVHRSRFSRLGGGPVFEHQPHDQFLARRPQCPQLRPHDLLVLDEHGGTDFQVFHAQVEGRVGNSRGPHADGIDANLLFGEPVGGCSRIGIQRRQCALGAVGQQQDAHHFFVRIQFGKRVQHMTDGSLFAWSLEAQLLDDGDVLSEVDKLDLDFLAKFVQLFPSIFEQLEYRLATRGPAGTIFDAHTAAVIGHDQIGRGMPVDLGEFQPGAQHGQRQ